MICASTVSPPTRVALISKEPLAFTVPPITSDPPAFSTGTGSPVIIDSSTKLDPFPSITDPSTGMRSPGRTITTSPGNTSSMGTSISRPPRRTRAVLACRPRSFFSAAEVRPLAMASRCLPSRMKVMIEAEASK